jgi:hypothetical protein
MEIEPQEIGPQEIGSREIAPPEIEAVEIEPLEMDDDELVWLALSGLPSERQLAAEELLQRQQEAAQALSSKD